MVLNSLAAGGRSVLGAVGFCSRIPVGHRERDWEAFRQNPAVLVAVAYPIGLLVSLPLVLEVPPETAAFLFPVWLYTVTGITHLDGLADVGDAVVAHGEEASRREAMRDSMVGVGAATALVISILGLALAGWHYTTLGWVPVVLTVLTAEVAAKFGMVLLVALGEPAHEGLGSALAGEAGRKTALVGSVLVLPVAALWAFHPEASAVGALALLGAPLLVSALVFRWAREHLGGVSGDVFGATNEITRVATLHLGVIVWSL